MGGRSHRGDASFAGREVPKFPFGALEQKGETAGVNSLAAMWAADHRVIVEFMHRDFQVTLAGGADQLGERPRVDD